MPQPQQQGILAANTTYTTAHGNARSLTHWARPGIEPASSWILVRPLTCWATTGTPLLHSLYEDRIYCTMMAVWRVSLSSRIIFNHFSPTTAFSYIISSLREPLSFLLQTKGPKFLQLVFTSSDFQILSLWTLNQGTSDRFIAAFC